MLKQNKTLRFLSWITLTILAIVLLTLISSPKPVAAQEGNPVVIYMFWGEGCPHCAAAKPYFEDLANKNPEIELRFFEIYNSVENQEKFAKMAEAYGFEAWGVPTIFIGDRYWEGYAETLQPEFESTINACIENGCKDAGAGIIVPASTQPVNPDPVNTEEEIVKNRKINIPLIGEIDLNNQPLIHCHCTNCIRRWRQPLFRMGADYADRPHPAHRFAQTCCFDWHYLYLHHSSSICPLHCRSFHFPNLYQLCHLDSSGGCTGCLGICTGQY